MPVGATGAVEADAVVAHVEPNLVRLEDNAGDDVARARMTDNVGHELLADSIQVLFPLRPERTGLADHQELGVGSRTVGDALDEALERVAQAAAVERLRA